MIDDKCPHLKVCQKTRRYRDALVSAVYHLLIQINTTSRTSERFARNLYQKKKKKICKEPYIANKFTYYLNNTINNNLGHKNNR